MCSVRPENGDKAWEKKVRRSVLDFGRMGEKEDEIEKRDGFIEKRKPQKAKLFVNRNPATRSIKNAFWSIFDRCLIFTIL